jgi:hypothetical protein
MVLMVKPFKGKPLALFLVIPYQLVLQNAKLTSMRANAMVVGHVIIRMYK